MKIAVYSIAKNEEQFVKQWVDSALDADLLLIGDTGSTDNTVTLAESLGVKVIDASVFPWRFDTARNITLNTIPEDFDYCIALDLDEVLLPGWREALEIAFKRGLNKPAYKFVMNWNADGSEGFVYHAHKVHSRKNFEWRLPIHEALYCTTEETRDFIEGFEIHHMQDDSHKPHRNQPLDLLNMAVQEDPMNSCVLFFYAREHYLLGNWDEAYNAFTKLLTIMPPDKEADTDRVLRYLAHIDEYNRREWLLRACDNCPDKREPWAVIAEYYFFNKEYVLCIEACEKAFSITDSRLGWEKEPWAWSYRIYEFAALSCYALGLDDKGLYYEEETLRRKEAEDGAFC